MYAVGLVTSARAEPDVAPVLPPLPTEAAYATFNQSLRQAKPAELEAVGAAPARAWVTPVNLFAAPDGHWVQLFGYKSDGRGNNSQIHLLTLDLTNSTTKKIGSIPGLQIPLGTVAWARGKLYFANQNTQAPGRLFAYDPAKQTVADLGQVSPTAGGAWKIAVGPDDTLSIAGSDMVLSLYDPAANEMRIYGRMGAGHNYIYSVTHDKEWIYAALRGKVPWQIVAINRATREQRVIQTAPVDAFAEVKGDDATITPKEGKPISYELHDGSATLLDPLKAAARVKAPVAPRPDVMLDEITGQVTWRYPDKPGEVKELALPVPQVGADVAYAVQLADGRMAATTYGYLPLTVFDPRDPARPVVQAPLGEVSVRALLAVGNSVFIAGYPSTIVMRYEADKPVTSRGQGEAATAPTDNPRLLRFFGKDLEGAHIGAPLVPDAQGRVWLVGRRHRYYRGFGVAWFDAKTEQTGVLKDEGAFNQFQIAWMSSMDGGKRLAIATHVQPNDQRPGRAGDSGKLFVVDTETEKIVGNYTPLPGFDTLLGVAQSDPDHLVGAAYKSQDAAKVVLYRFNMKTGATELIAPGPKHGEPGDQGLPGKGTDFLMGPDGNLWTFGEIGAQAFVLTKINPADLSATPVALLNGAMRILFDGDDVLLTGTRTPDGDARLHRLRGVLKR